MKPYLSPTTIFNEIGCGDAAFTRSLAPFVEKAIGIDVTSVLLDHVVVPNNFQFVITGGVEYGLPKDYADIIYSNHLMEHLHPEDSKHQLEEIFRVLKPSSLYICSTPNRLTEPHDMSVYFGYEPIGFHMREYDYASLAFIFGEVAFRSARARFSMKGRRVEVPVMPVALIEKLMLSLQRALRTRLAFFGPIRNLAGVTLIGRK